jgi:hypothetical protein
MFMTGGVDIIPILASMPFSGAFWLSRILVYRFEVKSVILASLLPS